MTRYCYTFPRDDARQSWRTIDSNLFSNCKHRFPRTPLLMLATAFAGAAGFTDAQAQDAGAVALPEVSVQAGGGGDVQTLPMLQQVPTLDLTGTKVEDLPLSIKVVPSDLISQQGGTQLSDALRNISGDGFRGAAPEPVHQSRHGDPAGHREHF